MQMRRIFLVVPLIFAFACPATAQQETGQRDAPSVMSPCPECGTIIDIREIASEREMAKLLPERAPPVGPVIRFNLGEGADSKPRVGAVGSEQMRGYLTERHYEVTIRYEDGRYGLITIPDASSYQVGDRIHIHKGRIEPDDRDLP